MTATPVVNSTATSQSQFEPCNAENNKFSNTNIPQKVNNFVLSNKVKLIVMVPKSHADKIREVIGSYGGGRFGNYSFCSFSTNGIARFQELTKSEVEAGSKGTYIRVKKVPEVRIETVVPIELVEELIKKIKAVHPYKEVQPDILLMLQSKL